MSERDELTANYDVLCKRIAALDKDAAIELDSERLATLKARRSDLVTQRDEIGARLALASWERSDHRAQNDTLIMDARIGSTENTLRTLDGKMDKLIDQVHDLDTRHRLLEAQVLAMQKQLDDLRGQMVLVRTMGETQIPRNWIMLAAVGLLAMLALLMLITYRVM